MEGDPAFAAMGAAWGWPRTRGERGCWFLSAFFVFYTHGLGVLKEVNDVRMLTGMKRTYTLVCICTFETREPPPLFTSSQLCRGIPGVSLEKKDGLEMGLGGCYGREISVAGGSEGATVAAKRRPAAALAHSHRGTCAGGRVLQNNVRPRKRWRRGRGRRRRGRRGRGGGWGGVGDALQLFECALHHVTAHLGSPVIRGGGGRSAFTTQTALGSCFGLSLRF